MEKIIKLEIEPWPEWLDLDFLKSCLCSESHITNIEIILKDITKKEPIAKYNH